MADAFSHRKRQYYARSEVVAAYERFRFGSAGGQEVGARELAAVCQHLDELPRAAKILDLPVGSGRLLRALRERGFSDLVGADTSAEMLALAARSLAGDVPLRREDAFATSFTSGQFDAAVSLRFAFHCEALAPLLGELARVVKPGGLVVFDTLRWSPRTLLPPLQQFMGGRVFAHHEAAVLAAAAAVGLVPIEAQRILLLPSQLYRWVAGPLLPPLRWLEHVLPDRLRSKMIWKMRVERDRLG